MILPIGKDSLNLQRFSAEPLLVADSALGNEDCLMVLFWFLFWFLFGSVSVIEMAVSVKEKATNPLELVA